MAKLKIVEEGNGMMRYVRETMGEWAMEIDDGVLTDFRVLELGYLPVL